MILPTKKPQQVRPSIRSGAISYFYGGVSLPAGTYRVKYGGAALQWGGNPAEWGVGDAFIPAQGFYIRRGGGADLYGPQLNSTYYPTASAAQLANAAAPAVTFTHTSGPIGMFLQDSNYSDNVPADWGSPLFILEFIGPAAAWSPSQLSGLIGWYRSDQGVWGNAARTIPATDGGAVRAWDDLSGNANHISQGPTQSPTFTAIGLNALPTVSFASASSQWLTRAGVAGMNVGQPLFLWSVIRPKATGRIFGVGSTAGNGIHLRIFSTTQIGTVTTAAFTDINALVFPGGTITNTWLRAGGWVVNPNERVIAANGQSPTSALGVSAVPTNTGIALGADWNGGAGFGWLDMDVAEYIVANQVPDTAALAQLDDYAKTRYALP